MSETPIEYYDSNMKKEVKTPPEPQTTLSQKINIKQQAKIDLIKFKLEKNIINRQESFKVEKQITAMAR